MLVKQAVEKTLVPAVVFGSNRVQKNERTSFWRTRVLRVSHCRSPRSIVSNHVSDDKKLSWILALRPRGKFLASAEGTNTI